MAGRFGTLVTAMATPFHADGSLDLPGAQRLADHLLSTGTDALVVAGSTGEGVTLRRNERSDLVRAVCEVAEGRGMVIAGTGTNVTAESVELTRDAAAAGADGILAVTPYYNRPPQRGLAAHFRAVAAASDLPVMLYDVPGRTGTRIEDVTLLDLAAVPTIVAVKDSTGDLQAAAARIASAPSGFDVYCGDDWAAFDFACLGAAGLVSVAAHLVGGPLHRMLDLVAAAELDAARAIRRDLDDLFAALFVTSNPIPLKAALAMLGLPCGPTRAPLPEPTDDERSRIRAALDGVGLG